MSGRELPLDAPLYTLIRHPDGNEAAYVYVGTLGDVRRSAEQSFDSVFRRAFMRATARVGLFDGSGPKALRDFAKDFFDDPVINEAQRALVEGRTEQAWRPITKEQFLKVAYALYGERPLVHEVGNLESALDAAGIEIA